MAKKKLPTIDDPTWPQAVFEAARADAKELADQCTARHGTGTVNESVLIVHGVATAGVKATQALARWIGELALQIEERNQRIDNALDAITDTMARAQSALKDINENGIRYRGFWRAGFSADRGDAYTEAGSLWWAVRETYDKPSYESPDWQLVARKGRDGK